MQNVAWYQGESLKRLLQGVALGAFATLGIGFSWGGFMLGSTAKTLADSAASSAVVAAIAPNPLNRRREKAWPTLSTVGTRRAEHPPYRGPCRMKPATCWTRSVVSWNASAPP